MDLRPGSLKTRLNPPRTNGRHFKKTIHIRTFARASMRPGSESTAPAAQQVGHQPRARLETGIQGLVRRGHQPPLCTLPLANAEQVLAAFARGQQRPKQKEAPVQDRPGKGEQAAGPPSHPVMPCGSRPGWTIRSEHAGVSSEHAENRLMSKQGFIAK
jgi:hypothetical protein